MQLTTAKMLVIFSHVNNNLFEVIRNTGTAALAAVLTSVILVGHKLAVPHQKCVRRESTADLGQHPPAEFLAEYSKPSSLSIVKDYTFLTCCL